MSTAFPYEVLSIYAVPISCWYIFDKWQFTTAVWKYHVMLTTDLYENSCDHNAHPKALHFTGLCIFRAQPQRKGRFEFGAGLGWCKAQQAPGKHSGGQSVAAGGRGFKPVQHSFSYYNAAIKIGHRNIFLWNILSTHYYNLFIWIIPKPLRKPG